MGVSGQDELRDTHLPVGLDEIRDLGVGADQGGPGATTEESDTRPQVRIDLETILGAAVQIEHPALAFRSAAPQARLRTGDVLVTDVGHQTGRFGPGGRGGLPSDRVQPNAETQLTAMLGGGLPDAFELLTDRRRRLAPGQVDVGMLGRDRDSGSRGAAEVDLRDLPRQVLQRGILHGEVSAGEVDRLARPQGLDDGEELVAPGIALLFAEEVAVHALVVVLTAGDHVERESARCEVHIRRRHLRCDVGHHGVGTESDQELQPLRDGGEHRRGDPRVLAPEPSRDQSSFEADLLGRTCDLTEIAHRGRSCAGAANDAVATSHDGSAVAAVGGDEPVELDSGHARSSIVVVVGHKPY